jgi:nucleoside-diphosphate-sugar epimerase
MDSRSEKNLYEYFDKPDAMIHCAWEKLGAAEYKNSIHTTDILDKHKLFVHNLIKNGLKDITVIGSCYEYGLTEGVLKEDMPSKPTVEYSIAKNLLREYIEQEFSGTQGQVKWVRVFYVFGEVKGRKNLYTQLVEAIQRGDKTFNMSGGEQIRDFLSSEQIADIIAQISLQKKTTGIINCCSGRPVRLKDYINDFLEKNNYKIELNFGFYPYPDYEPMWTWGSVDKLNAALKA